MDFFHTCTYFICCYICITLSADLTQSAINYTFNSVVCTPVIMTYIQGRIQTDATRISGFKNFIPPSQVSIKTSKNNSIANVIVSHCRQKCLYNIVLTLHFWVDTWLG